MTIPLSSDAFGAITASTSGGTSAPFTRTLSSIASTALSGTAADPAKASANAGQAVTLVGGGLANTRILFGYTDYFGRERFEWVETTNPTSDGMSAGISIPNLANGLLKVWLLGSSNRLELQIVPTITSVTINAYGMVEIQGSGFVDRSPISDRKIRSSNKLRVSSLCPGLTRILSSLKHATRSTKT